ncbi:energy transducer TonB [Microbulbifer rhizosphaerae]|uniref:Protein TonB n=1 Tax=Microbulbifer rhizosphaerae TaxID=1562603 RepID=A0A7W4WD85_9GAMM|nr:energy transducer TonB [Microbulbifer rhizosphaerae]MBB3062085.1 protein TonB [Microbulbifer rhizosphaerae]
MDRAYPQQNPFVFFVIASTYSRSLGLAAISTLALLFIMSHLIATDYTEPPEDNLGPIKPVHMPTREPTVIRNDPPQPPQAVPPQPVTTIIETTVDPVVVPTLIAPPRPQGSGTEVIVSRDPIPVFKPAARYPSAALRRGIEGYVVVEFTITKSGSVRDPRAVAGYDSEGRLTDVFNRSAVAAAARFKYQPQLEDGKPVERHGVRNRIRYQIAD